MRDRPKRLAEKLLAIRQQLALSQSELAERINPRMHYGRVSEYELGKRQPPVLVLLAYARVARVALESIVDDAMDMKF